MEVKLERLEVSSRVALDPLSPPGQKIRSKRSANRLPKLLAASLLALAVTVPAARADEPSEKPDSDESSFQFGAEYALTDELDLRAGYVYDQSPVNGDYEDYAVPCTDRQIVTLGAGWAFREDWTVDVSYGYLWMKDRDYEARPAEGIVELSREDAHAHMAGLSLTYRF